MIGAGSTGAATAHDLALRGLPITVIECGEMASETTGRNHCLLHSGGRYCVTDQESAIEYIEENMILRPLRRQMTRRKKNIYWRWWTANMAYGVATALSNAWKPARKPLIRRAKLCRCAANLQSSVSRKEEGGNNGSAQLS